MSKIAEVFNIEAVPITMEPARTIIPETISEEDKDFDIAREIQHELLEQGRAAINTTMRIVAESENVRGVEVLSGLLKNVSDMNKQLVTLHKDKAEVKNTKHGKVVGGQAGPQIQTQQNLFVGSSTDINKMLAEKLAQTK